MVALENRRRQRDPDRVRLAVFPERLLLSPQTHLFQAPHRGVCLGRSGTDLQYDGLCRRHAVPGWKDRPDDFQHAGRLRQRSGEHAGCRQYPSLRPHRLHDARESELHEPDRKPEHAVSEFAAQSRSIAHELLRQLPSVAARLLRADHRTEFLHERGASSGRHEARRECAGDREQDLEGLLRRPDDSRSRVQILSRDLAEPDRARQDRADLSGFHARRDGRRASELLDHSRSPRDQWARLPRCRPLHGAGGRPPQRDHRLLPERSLVRREQRSADRHVRRGGADRCNVQRRDDDPADGSRAAARRLDLRRPDGGAVSGPQREAGLSIDHALSLRGVPAAVPRRPRGHRRTPWRVGICAQHGRVVRRPPAGRHDAADCRRDAARRLVRRPAVGDADRDRQLSRNLDLLHDQWLDADLGEHALHHADSDRDDDDAEVRWHRRGR